MLIQPILGTPRSRWKALGKPLKKLKTGVTLNFSGTLGTIISKQSDTETPYVEIEFPMAWAKFYEWISHHGHVPLPPYIKRERDIKAKDSEDLNTYQTVYAKDNGSVAAPTAGLHLTDSLIKSLTRDHDIEFVDVTLHVGAGTFLPVKTDSLDAHQMHSEMYFVSNGSYQTITEGRSQGRPIIAVGTTSLRCLESFYLKGKEKENWQSNLDSWHETDLFIWPQNPSDQYKPFYLDGLITNFHQPESTLLMLISSLIGYENMRKVYRHAVQNEYRFFSYGDSSVLLF